MWPGLRQQQRLRCGIKIKLGKMHLERAHIPGNTCLSFSLRSSPDRYDVALAAKAGRRVLSRRKGRRSCMPTPPLPASLSATARQRARERGWQAGCRPKKANINMPQAQWRQRNAIRASRNGGAGSVRCAYSGKGRSGAWDRSVVRQPCTPSPLPLAKPAVAPRASMRKKKVAGPERAQNSGCLPGPQVSREGLPRGVVVRAGMGPHR